VLALHLGDAEGLRAAIGWRGDRYRIWEDEAGRFVIAYRVVAADGEAAAALAANLLASVEKRRPALAGKAAIGAGGLVTWGDAGRVSVLERRGTSIVLLENLPPPALDRARDAVWRARSAGASR
jgi:hypothetical protein